MATIEKRGPGQFRAIVRRKGYPAMRQTFPTRAHAEAWARSIENPIDRGEYLDHGEASTTTLHEAIERYIREATRAKRGARQEERRLRAWQRHPIAQKTLTRLRGADFATYRDERLAKVGPNTVRLELAPISNLFKLARTEWGMEGLRNPMENVRKPTPGKARERRLEGDEEARILAECDPVMRVAVVLAIETAMRRGELASIRREWIRGRVVYLPKTKNGDPRAVPLSPRALEALDELPARIDGHILPAADLITHQFGEACERAKVEGLTFHDLRHEATSRLFERGLQLMEVAAITGHKDIRMLRRYTHLRADDLAEKLSAPLLARRSSGRQ